MCTLLWRYYWVHNYTNTRLVLLRECKRFSCGCRRITKKSTGPAKRWAHFSRGTKKHRSALKYSTIRKSMTWIDGKRGTILQKRHSKTRKEKNPITATIILVSLFPTHEFLYVFISYSMTFIHFCLCTHTHTHEHSLCYIHRNPYIFMLDTFISYVSVLYIRICILCMKHWCCCCCVLFFLSCSAWKSSLQRLKQESHHFIFLMRHLHQPLSS